MDMNANATAIACSLDSEVLSERSRRWRALADRAIIDVSLTEAGLRLRFRPEPGVESELEELAGLERDCCAFASWTVSPTRQEVTLTVSGDGREAIAIVQ